MTGSAPDDRRPLLSRARHDRAALRRRDLEWLLEAGTRAQVLVVTGEQTVPVHETEAGPRLDFRELSTVDGQDWVFLGEHDGVAYAAVRGEPDLRADRWLGLRDVGAELTELEAGLFVEAVALAQWHERHRFCPLCGRPTRAEDAGWVRRCPDGHDQFPRTDPAVIMLVHDGAERCILGRQAVWPAGRFSILAGFVEPGESTEEAVAREVLEEVGLTVTDVRYAGSQPWPFPASLMLGFTARVTGDPTLRVDLDELAEAQWFTRTEVAGFTGTRMADFSRAGAAEPPGLRRLPPPVSIAHRIITDWLERRLPVGPG